ncbi:MAG TPA: hypothetical protein PLF23_15890, partial [Candidatus Obscuribacter sp.]|nr:hypothetical protein [Candidatus Obscuribacter sp.]
IHPDEHRMETEVHAQVKKDNIDVEGIGASGDSNLKKVKFKKNVTVLVQDPKDPATDRLPSDILPMAVDSVMVRLLAPAPRPGTELIPLCRSIMPANLEIPPPAVCAIHSLEPKSLGCGASTSLRSGILPPK